MDVVKWWLLLFTYLCVFPHFCSATEIKCDCTYDGDETKCIIAEESRILNASGCEFSWSDADANVVLATAVGKDEKLVKTYSINELVTFNRLNTTAFSRHCQSEKQKFTASCSISRTEIPRGPLNQKGSTDPTVSTPTDGPAEGGGDSNNTWMIAGIAVFVAVGMFAVLAGVLYCQRDKIRRTQRWQKLSSIWTRVKTVDDDHRPAGGVEMEFV